jgi:hypothetical protein
MFRSMMSPFRSEAGLPFPQADPLFDTYGLHDHSRQL